MAGRLEVLPSRAISFASTLWKAQSLTLRKQARLWELAFPPVGIGSLGTSELRRRSLCQIFSNN
jgi:hypothetical protein